MQNTANKIFQLIDRAQHIMLVPHPNPDGDTLGSVSALYSWLISKNKVIDVFCKTPISSKLSYLPNIEKVLSDPSVWHKPSIDVVIVCDSGDLGYAGIDEYIQFLSPNAIIINFDHHKTNTYFGHHNMVIDTESSTTAVLYRFFSYNNIDIDKTMATGLMTGLVTDTNHFSNSATSKSSLHIASKLVEYGAHIDVIRTNIVKDKSIDGLKLWGTVLKRLSHHAQLDLVHTSITQEDIVKHHATEADIEGVANFLNGLNEGSFAMILKEQSDNLVKGSFRTTRDDIDVSAMAQHFGGGGHKKAAGFTIDVPIESAVDYVLRELTLFLKR